MVAVVPRVKPRLSPLSVSVPTRPVAEAVKAKLPLADYSFNPEFGDKIDFSFKQAPPDEAGQKALQDALRAAVEGARKARAVMEAGPLLPAPAWRAPAERLARHF